MNQIKVLSSSPDSTVKLAQKIGKNLKGGEVIELVSDIGGGKTTFTKGLARAIGAGANVNSPSFVIEHEYKSDKLTVHHLDFYRLNDPGIMSDMLREILTDPRAVTVIEWSDIIKDVLPNKRLIIKLKPVSLEQREITITYSKELDYLVEGLD